MQIHFNANEGGFPMLFRTTDTHEKLRAEIRSFAEAEVKPQAFLMDKENEFPTEAVKKMGELGFMSVIIEIGD